MVKGKRSSGVSRMVIAQKVTGIPGSNLVNVLRQLGPLQIAQECGESQKRVCLELAGKLFYITACYLSLTFL